MAAARAPCGSGGSSLQNLGVTRVDFVNRPYYVGYRSAVEVSSALHFVAEDKS